MHLKKLGGGGLAALVFVIGIQWSVMPLTPLADSTIPEVESLGALGPINVTTLLVEFPDCPHETHYQQQHDIVYQNVSSLYREESFERASIIGQSRNWTMVSQNKLFYARGLLSSENDTESEEASVGAEYFRREVLSMFSWVPANFTEQILILYSGAWSVHPHNTKEELSVSGDNMTCRVSVSFEGNSSDVIQTIAHELGHGIGLPDYYKKDNDYYEDYGEYYGPWALMATGSHFCGYSKLVLGWIDKGQLLEITSNTSLYLEGVDRPGKATKLARVKIDNEHYYLVESRMEPQQPGILISLVDLTRLQGGYGRLSVVRSFRAADQNSPYGAYFMVGEAYSDAANGIRIEAAYNDSRGVVVDVRFGRYDRPLVTRSPWPHSDDATAVAATNQYGEVFLAVRDTSPTSNRQDISVYELTSDGPFLLYTTPINMTCANPNLLIYNHRPWIVYEGRTNSSQSVFLQDSGGAVLLSGNKTAGTPAAAVLWSRIYVGYESYSNSARSIEFLSTDTRHVEHLDELRLSARSGRTPSKPDLSGRTSLTVSVVWDGKDVELLRRDSEGWTSVNYIYTSRCHRQVICCIQGTDTAIAVTEQKGDTALSSVYFLDRSGDQMQQIGLYRGIARELFSMNGVWAYIETDGEGRIVNAMNRQFSTGSQMEIPWRYGQCIATGRGSIQGNPGVFAIVSNEGELRILKWFASTIPDRGLPRSIIQPARLLFTLLVTVVIVGTTAYMTRTRNPETNSFREIIGDGVRQKPNWHDWQDSDVASHGS